MQIVCIIRRKKYICLIANSIWQLPTAPSNIWASGTALKCWQQHNKQKKMARRSNRNTPPLFPSPSPLPPFNRVCRSDEKENLFTCSVYGSRTADRFLRASLFTLLPLLSLSSFYSCHFLFIIRIILPIILILTMPLSSFFIYHHSHYAIS